MDQTIDWRSPDFPNIFDLYDRADFAQEFLRRSPAYRADYAAIRRLPRGGAARAIGRLADHWGLLFRP